MMTLLKHFLVHILFALAILRSTSTCTSDKTPDWCNYNILKHPVTFLKKCEKIGSKVQVSFCCKTCSDLSVARSLHLPVETKIPSPNSEEPPNCHNLYDAVGRDDKTCIVSLLEIGDDINELNSHGNSALNRAVELENEAMIRFLIDRDADVNHKNSKGVPPIYSIVGNYHVWSGDNYELLEFIINHDADVNAVSTNNGRPLHEAAYYGKTESVRVLLKHGADVHVRKNNGKNDSALKHAVDWGHEEVNNLLVEAGAEYYWIVPTEQESGSGFDLVTALNFEHGSGSDPRDEVK